MVTLATLEAELARRVGPYESPTVAFLPVATTTVAHVDALTSTIDLGGLEGLWLWRRAPSTEVLPTPAFATGDRVRRVKSYDPATGALEVDRAWTDYPRGGEVVELVAMEPERRLRVAVQRGLERSFFVDRVSVTISTYAAERNLTASVPWLLDPTHLLDLDYLPTGSTERPSPVGWWVPVPIGGAVWVQMGPDPAPASLTVTALRPHASWVNGATSTTGPTADGDTLAVSPEYAAVMAHEYLWDTARDLLRPLAADGMGTPEAAVREAAARYRARLPRRPDRLYVPPRLRTRLTL